MIRINCVPVSELAREHLIAEYRELPRVYRLAKMSMMRGERPDCHPLKYQLGKSHVRFFYSRLGYVRNRHRQLIEEMKRRGYAVNFPDVPNLSYWPQDWLRGWEPDEKALEQNRARIWERLAAKGVKENRT
jgi:deoxyribonuclease (pyrimidine dimer)